MMKRVLLASVLVAMAGCTTVEISSPGSLGEIDVKGAGGKADRVIMLGNEGYYFFHTWPIMTGDVSWNARKGGIVNEVEMFSDELKGDRMAEAMSRYAESQNCDLVDLVVSDRYNAGIGAWFNIIINCKSVVYSGVLRPRKK